ncbi:carbohydrate esterase family 16 protein [Desarmillaria tabescens]|uniref:Carbohydrate esterase family 16 protein n=1 Tax=Armillaria tabescens TaxID=1929756 RepID=A0AA39T366_ARMTA|nr:carbohydrate esterase family 16 protein [Desarmillaria tabescens]KAK0461141.1 carbohydrate esterase family 16 protein [Desarmillaria tabescens]
MYFPINPEAIQDGVQDHWCSSLFCVLVPQLFSIMKRSLCYLVTILGLSQCLSLKRDRNDGIHLAVGPRCGTLNGNVSDINAGVNPYHFKTVVSFGDSYTDGGVNDGSASCPSWGRSTDGPVWIEWVANATGAKLMDYAQSGACIDLALWPSNPRKVDFLGQMSIFLNQSNVLDPDTTLYSIFFGINDYIASLIDGDHMQEAAQVLLDQIKILSSAPTNGRSFMVLDVYGRGTHTPSGEAFKQTIYNGLSDFHIGSDKLNVAYVDFSRIWDGVLGTTPGYEAFGYTSTNDCVDCSENCDANGWCLDPAHYFYWISGHPSNETMRIMADYVHDVLTECQVA